MYVVAKDYLLRDFKKGELGLYYKEDLISSNFVIEEKIYEGPCYFYQNRFPKTDKEKSFYEENQWLEYTISLSTENKEEIQTFRLSDLIPRGHSVKWKKITIHGLNGSYLEDQTPDGIENNYYWPPKEIFYDDKKDSSWIPFEDFHTNDPILKRIFF